MDKIVPSVEFHIPVTLNENFSHMMYFLARSIEKFSRLTPNYKIIFTVSLDSTVDQSSPLLCWTKDHPIEFNYCDEHLWKHYCRLAKHLERGNLKYNATALHQLAYNFEADTIIFMDADMVVCGPLDELALKVAHTDAIFGWPAWKPPSINIVSALEARGCQSSGFGLQYSGYGWDFLEPKESPPYFNCGFVAANKNTARILARNLKDDLEFVSDRYYDLFSWQVALCLLIVRKNIKYEILSEKYNYGNGDGLSPIHPQIADKLIASTLLCLEDARVLHYCAKSRFFKKRIDLASWEAVQRFCLRDDLEGGNRLLKNTLKQFLDRRWS
jgi:hypothetical protein